MDNKALLYLYLFENLNYLKTKSKNQPSCYADILFYFQIKTSNLLFPTVILQ